MMASASRQLVGDGRLQQHVQAMLHRHQPDLAVGP